MLKRVFFLVGLALALPVLIPAQEAERLAELDAYWAEVSRSVKAGDFEGYSATVAEDAVLVLSAQKKSYPLANALARWKKDFDRTKAGEVAASVEFRFAQRVGDATTAHETGIFLYQATPKDGGAAISDYMAFEGLLLKRDGEWKILMEYQKALTTKEAWDALKPVPPKTGLPMAGETLSIGGRQAFVIMPAAEQLAKDKPVPWVMYAPTLPRLPGGNEKWMFEKFLAKGIAIAGIDVGESYGNPAGRKSYTDLHATLVKERNFSTKPVLLARSRGGLMLYSWAVEHPESVGGVAGIYPVCNFKSYPGLDRAAKGYGMTAAELDKASAEHNPVDRLKPLAQAKVPVLHLHGDKDRVVPLDANSALLVERYKAHGGPGEVMVVKDGKHDGWSGWFENERLTAFVIKHARGE